MLRIWKVEIVSPVICLFISTIPLTIPCLRIANLLPKLKEKKMRWDRYKPYLKKMRKLKWKQITDELRLLLWQQNDNDRTDDSRVALRNHT